MLCLELARATDLSAASAELTEVSGAPCLVASRFDRVVTEGEVLGINQEDAC